LKQIVGFSKELLSNENDMPGSLGLVNVQENLLSKISLVKCT